MDLIKVAEEAFATGKQHPEFRSGDTVTVAYKIIEGNKERIQLYRGVVIKIAGHGDKKRFTVRKMSGTVGVERIFPIESPNIESIEVNKYGKVRRSTISANSLVRKPVSRREELPLLLNKLAAEHLAKVIAEVCHHDTPPYFFPPQEAVHHGTISIDIGFL